MSMELVLNIIAALAGLLVALSLFPGLSWLLKLRILAVVLLGMVVIGILAWPIVAPDEPGGIISMPGSAGAVLLMVSALGVGFVAYFITWPSGTQIGVIAVPAGLAVWAVRSANVAHAMTNMGSAEQRVEFFSSLMPEPFFWLLIVACGFGGTLLARRVLAPSAGEDADVPRMKPVSKNPMNIAAAILASAVIAFFVVSLLARDIGFSDEQLGHVTAQPSTGQIAFAVFVSFALAAFIVRNYPGVGFEWPAVSTAIVSTFGLALYSRGRIIEYLAVNWPANLFASAHSAILPLQMVSFGTLGAIAGFWLVESFETWRHQEQ